MKRARGGADENGQGAGDDESAGSSGVRRTRREPPVWAVGTPVAPAPVQVIGIARSPFGGSAVRCARCRCPSWVPTSLLVRLTSCGVVPEEVDEVALGVNFPGSDRSIARQVLLRAGIPDDRIAYTVDRACCSSLTAINLAAKSIRLGEARVAVAGGVENLSRVPYFLETARFGQRLGDVVLTDQLVVACPHSGVPRAVQASTEAAAYGVGRTEQDEWACRSQSRYADALARGHFDDEIVGVSITDASGRLVELDRDEVPRPGTSMAVLRQLPHGERQRRPSQRATRPTSARAPPCSC